MKRMQNQAKSVSKRTWREKMTYMKKNWQLYLFFLMPVSYTHLDVYKRQI